MNPYMGSHNKDLYIVPFDIIIVLNYYQLLKTVYTTTLSVNLFYIHHTLINHVE